MKKLLILVTALIAMYIVANGLMALRVESQLNARRAALRAVGQPASIADLASAPVPDQDNAAAHLAALKPQLDAFSREYSAFYDSELGKSYSDAAGGNGPTAAQVAAIRTMLDSYPQLDDGIAQAAACDLYVSKLNFTLGHSQFLQQLLPPVQDFRAVARYAGWRMQVLVEDGKHEEAVRRGIELLRLTRLRDEEPTLVSYLVNLAVRGIAVAPLYDALAAGPISNELHVALDQELALHDDLHRLAEVLQTERAVGLDAVGSSVGPARGAAGRFFGWPMRRHYLGYLDYFEQLVSALDSPPHEARQRVQQLNASQERTFGWMAASMTPAVQAALEADYRTIATLRALRVFNALRQFAAASGREASDLRELNLPPQAIIDPYSGQPLKLKLTEDGWIVYSVMQNGVDDGGDFRELKDYGVAPAGKWRRTNSVNDE